MTEQRIPAEDPSLVILCGDRIRVTSRGANHSDGRICVLKPRKLDSLLHTKVLFVVQHIMMLEGLLAAVRKSLDIDVVGASFRPPESAALVESLAPDVIVLGVEPPESGIAMATELREAFPELGIVILAPASDDFLQRKALDNGCAAVITFGSTITDLVTAVDAAANGHTTLPLGTLERLANPREQTPVKVGLTTREKEILALLGMGETTASIALRLTLSPHTVRNHVRNLLSKLDVHTRLEAVVLAHNLGLIDQRPKRPRTEDRTGFFDQLT